MGIGVEGLPHYVITVLNRPGYRVAGDIDHCEGCWRQSEGVSLRVRGNRTARLRAMRDEVAQEVEVAMEVNVAMDIGPSTMPLPLMPEA